MRFSGGPKRRGIFFRILELPSITIKQNKHLFDKKLHELTIVGVPWALVSIKNSFCFDTFFALFSILSGNYDGFGSMQSNIWCDFLLLFLSLFLSLFLLLFLLLFLPGFLLLAAQLLLLLFSSCHQQPAIRDKTISP